MRTALLLAALSLSACATKRPPAHALIRSDERYLDWDQLHGPFGIDPVTEAQARGRWHYAFIREKGQVVEIIHVSPTGEPFVRRKLSTQTDGSARVDFYDQWGTLDRIMVVDANGYESVTHRSGVAGSDGCHHKRHVADAAGVIVETTCYDDANHPIVGDDGCERIQWVRDARRHAIEVACLRADGAKATFSSGFHRSRVTVDAIGSVTAVDYLDASGAPVSIGCAHEERSQTASGSIARRSCRKKDGAFDWETRWAYDANDCVAQIASVDAYGKPHELVGVAFTDFESDAHCAVLRRESRDAHGRLSGNVAIRTFVHDVLGQMRIERCFDSLRQPISCISISPGKRHGSEVRYDRDERGRITRMRCYTHEGKPDVCFQGGSHEERREFGADGRESSRSYFDATGRPTLVTGIARTTYGRDAFGSVIVERNFGVDGAALTPDGGCHELRWTYDAHHRLASVECRDELGFARTNVLCMSESYGSKTCFAKGATLIRIVREGGKVENVHLGPTGDEILRVDCEKGYCIR